jgi:hypothetical protein
VTEIGNLADGVAVGLGGSHGLGADHAGSARAVFHRDRLPSTREATWQMARIDWSAVPPAGQGQMKVMGVRDSPRPARAGAAVRRHRRRQRSAGCGVALREGEAGRVFMVCLLWVVTPAARLKAACSPIVPASFFITIQSNIGIAS